MDPNQRVLPGGEDEIILLDTSGGGATLVGDDLNLSSDSADIKLDQNDDHVNVDDDLNNEKGRETSGMLLVMEESYSSNGEKVYHNSTSTVNQSVEGHDSERLIDEKSTTKCESHSVLTMNLDIISSSNPLEDHHQELLVNGSNDESGENQQLVEAIVMQSVPMNIENISVRIAEPEKLDEDNTNPNKYETEKLGGDSIARVRERRISRRIVVNTDFQALTSITTSDTPIHNVDIFDDSEIENDTSTYSSDDEDGIISNVKDGYFEDSSSDLKGSDILSVKSSDTDGILMNSNGSVLKVNEDVKYYPSVNEINNTNKAEPKTYSSIIFESKHDLKRTHQFESIISHYKEYVTKNPNHFRKLIRNGIPTKDLLKTLWKRMVGSEELSNKYPGLYKKLTLHDDILEDDVHKIMKDVHRTYPQYEFFSEKDGPGQQSLIRILKAYCHFDKQTGYCQGMAFICGFALMNLEDEEDTFWFFVQIMNNSKHGLKDIFAEGLPRLRLVMFMVSDLIKLRLPDIHKHLEENYILPEMYASSILMTLCTNRFSFAASQRIWSIFLNEGWKM